MRARGVASESLRILLTRLRPAAGLQPAGVDVDAVGEFLRRVGEDQAAGGPGHRDDRTVVADLRARRRGGGDGGGGHDRVLPVDAEALRLGALVAARRRSDWVE